MIVHGEEEAQKAQDAARSMFGGAGDTASMPAVEIAVSEFDAAEDNKLDILSLLVLAGLAKSRSEARRAVEQGGVTAGEEKISDIKTAFAASDIPADGLILRKGKKNYKKLIVK